MTFVAGSREPLLDLREAEQRTGLKLKTIRTAIANGHLRARRPPGVRRLYVLVEDLDAWATAPAPTAEPESAVPAPDPGKVRELRRRDAQPGSVARLDELEERSAAR